MKLIKPNLLKQKLQEKQQQKKLVEKMNSKYNADARKKINVVLSNQAMKKQFPKNKNLSLKEASQKYLKIYMQKLDLLKRNNKPIPQSLLKDIETLVLLENYFKK